MPPKRKRKALAPAVNSSDSEGVNGGAAESDSDDSNSSSPSNNEDEDEAYAVNTPSKKPPGRPRKKPTPPKKQKQKQLREETPPRSLAPHERFFFDNRRVAQKTSGNTLSSSTLLSHEDYFEAMKGYKDPHRHDISFLHAVYAQSFEQWWFEMNQGFSVCLHGWGSKREVVHAFAQFVVSEIQDAQRVVVVNGYASGVTMKDVLHTLASTIPELDNGRISGIPADAVREIFAKLPNKGPPSRLLLVNSLDNANLRKPATQSLLARLAAHPSIAVLASCDTPNFQLLWDVRMRTCFNWAFHDTTTFLSFSDAEVPAVDAVNALLGRSSRKVQGRDGVLFVLRSLTESARRLFALLLAEALEASGEGTDGVGTIEYKGLYRRAVESLIAASEMQFRQLLKEFFDHEMVNNERDSTGTEYLGVPFRREECESILEELTLAD